jgi:hypothetical protein
VFDLRNRVWALALFTLVVAGVAACSEKLDGGAACPALCPEQNRVEVRDTLLEGVISLDTSIVGYPTEGNEAFLLVSSRRDTLDTRAIVRFDTLITRVTTGGVDTTVQAIDSVTVVLRFDRDRSKTALGATLEAYDVDTQSDTVHADILAKFVPANLVGSATISATEIPDSIIVPLSPAAVLAKITGGLRLRLGFRLVGAAGASAQARFFSRESGAAARLTYDPAPVDTAVKMQSIAPYSNSPANNDILRSDHTDYTIVALGNAPRSANVIAIGGLPSRRGFLRFDVPAKLVDSSTVLRATLLLTQTPSPFVDPKDTIIVYPQVVAAVPAITDVTRAADILTLPGVGIDSLLLTPGDSGLRQVDMVQVFKQWQAQTHTTTPSQRALVLRPQQEGSSPLEALFFSTDAPAALRPRLRVTYVARLEFGIP